MWAPSLLAVTLILAVYLPTLQLGLVAEDYQIALKGAKVLSHPSELLRPFQHVWRPAAFGSFAALVGLFDAHPIAWRAVGLMVTAALAGLGLTLLRRLGDCSPGGAAVLGVMWLVSPLSSEPICGEAGFLGHQLFMAGVLLVLLGRLGREGGAGVVAVIGGGVLAAAASEQWVVLPVLLAAQDLLVLGRTRRQAAHTLLSWGAAVAAYLVAYGAITGFGYRSFYSLDSRLLAAKCDVLAAAFFQLIQPAPGDFAAVLREHVFAAVAAPVLLGVLIAFLVRARRRAGLLLLLASALLLLPTLPSPTLAGRWTALPWLLFLGAVSHPLAAAWRLESGRTVVRASLLGLCVVVAVSAILTVRGDIADWRRLDVLTRRLDAELDPLLSAGRAGSSLVVFRYGDSAVWRDMLERQRGQAKAFMPRPDDPYGVVSLSALLTWRTYRQGLAWRRLAAQPATGSVAIFAHEAGGFREVASAPPQVAAALARRSSDTTRFVGAVVLQPVPWAEFDASQFP